MVSDDFHHKAHLPLLHPTQPANDFHFPYTITPTTLGGVETFVTVAEAQDPIATLHFIKGFKSHPHYYNNFLNALTKAGINVVLVTLPDPGDKIGYMDDFDSIVHAVTIEGALDHLTSPNTPTFIGGHSTGVFTQTKILKNEDNARRYRKRYTGSPIFAAGFYGNSIYRHNFTKAAAHVLEKIMGSNNPVGTTWLEKAFSGAAEDDDSGAPEHYQNTKIVANRRQARYMDLPTSEFIDEVRATGFNETARSLRPIFLLGEGDKVSSNALSMEVAEAMNGTHIIVNGGHSLIRKSEDGRNFVISHIQKTLGIVQPQTPHIDAAPQSNELSAG